MQLPGVIQLQARTFADERGSFLKTYSQPDLDALGIAFTVREHYVSVSKKHVLRGMHFQAPPSDHDKLVVCGGGRVLDVLLDCRTSCATYGEVFAIELDGASGDGLFIPSGCAHGFLSLAENSTMHYLVSSAHDPERDAGILWDSFGFDWPVQSPILSPRDTGHPPWAEFTSPFQA